MRVGSESLVMVNSLNVLLEEIFMDILLDIKSKLTTNDSLIVNNLNELHWHRKFTVEIEQNNLWNF